MLRMDKTMELLEAFYSVVRSKININDAIWLPHSSVVYVREAIFNRTGEWFPLQQVHKAMYWEGGLHPSDYGIPLWYQRKWMRKTHKTKPVFIQGIDYGKR